MQKQRVRTSMGTIGVPDAASNCYLHKGMHADVKGSALMQVTIASLPVKQLRLVKAMRGISTQTGFVCK